MTMTMKEDETKGVEVFPQHRFKKAMLLNIIQQKCTKLHIILLFLVGEKNNLIKRLVKVYKIQHNQRI